jgi:hypothetical protein
MEVTTIAGKRETIHLQPEDLYRLPVHGWSHGIRCLDTPERVAYLATEPFLYNVAGIPAAIPNCTGEVEHTYSALTATKIGGVGLTLWSNAKTIEVRLDGVPVALDAANPLLYPAFHLPVKDTPLHLDIRVRTLPAFDVNLIVYRGFGTANRLPDYDWFSPPPEELKVSPSVVTWGMLPDTAFQ